MIKADTLREFRPSVRYKDGNGITLQTVQEAIKDCAQGMGVPVAFYNEQVKSGGLFNSSVEDCIVMYHPEHQNDYFKFCIRVGRQGTYAFVSVNDFGQSKQMAKADRAEFAKQDRKGKSMSYRVGSMIGSGIANIGKSKQKGFSAIINPSKLVQQESQVIDFLKIQARKSQQNMLFSRFIPMRADSLGIRETRHVVLNNKIISSSRLLYSLKHTVPKSHRIRAQEIIKQIENLGTFPSNYILDLGEFIGEDEPYLDVIEFNPISCSMCFVNNSIFEIAVPEISKIKGQLQLGLEFCYDAISHPQNYELTRVSNRNYTYLSEERYSFL